MDATRGPQDRFWLEYISLVSDALDELLDELVIAVIITGDEYVFFLVSGHHSSFL